MRVLDWSTTCDTIDMIVIRLFIKMKICMFMAKNSIFKELALCR